MKLIVGLGNPTKRYKNTRHNTGFRAIDFVVSKLDQHDNSVHSSTTREWKFEKKFNSEILKLRLHVHHQDQDILFSKPQTYMNDTGRAVFQISSFFHIEKKDVLIVYDDIDLLFEDVRFRNSGSSAGHKGMQSIIDFLGTDEIPRVRVGINNENRKEDTESYVLKEFSLKESQELPRIFDNVLKYVLSFMNDR